MAFTQIINFEEARRKLRGLTAVLDHLGVEEVKAQFTDGIAAAQNEFEQLCHIWIYPRKVVTYPASGAVQGTDYDEIGTPQDFYTSSYPASARFTVPGRPINSIERLAIEYGLTRNLFTYPTDWIRFNPKMGSINILPPVNFGSASAVANVGGVYFLPLLRGGFLNNVVPLLVSIDYTAGIADAATNPNWARLRQCIAEMNAITFRTNNAGLIANSVGRDGVSVSFDSNPDQIQMLMRSVEKYMGDFRTIFNPVRMQFV